MGHSRHPVGRDTLITRISRWSLRAILAGYLLSMAALAAVGAWAVESWGRHSGPYGTALRETALDLFSPGNLLGQGGQTAPFYGVAVAASSIAYLSPVFLLGSFVFKLFARDPIVWRRTVTIEDRVGCGAVLVFRLYNASRRPLVGMSFRVSAEIETRTSPTSVISRRLMLSTRGTSSARSRGETPPPPEPAAGHSPDTFAASESRPSHGRTRS